MKAASLAGIAAASAILAADGSEAARERDPYGYAPRALTWNAPPDYMSHGLPHDGGSIRLPRAVSEVDVWMTDREGRASYRLRQRGRCWTTARSRSCRVIAVPRRGRDELRSDYGAARHGLVVYGWHS
jgi:hypothetical protein